MSTILQGRPDRAHDEKKYYVTPQLISTFNNDVTVLAESRTLHWVSERGAGSSLDEIQIRYRHDKMRER